MYKADCVAPKEDWEMDRLKTVDEFRKIAAVTDLDREIANQRIRTLSRHWPFKNEIILRENSGSEYDNLLEKTVAEMLSKKLSWNQGHYNIAEYFISKQDYNRAAMEYQAVIKVTPSNYYPYLELGDVLLQLNLKDDAERIYEKGLALSTNLPYGYAKLGMLYLLNEKPKDAAEKLTQAIAANQRTHKFRNKDLANAYYLLSVAEAQLANYDAARTAAREALKLRPHYLQAQNVLEQLDNLSE